MIDAAEADRQFHTTTPILQGCESVEMAFKGYRDLMLFTTKRLIFIDPQGWTGQKVSYKSIPWRSIQAFAVQSAGSWFDKDSELMIWTDIFYDPPPPPPPTTGDEADGPPPPQPPPQPGMAFIEQNFEKDKVDLAAVGRYLANRCAPLGKDASQPSRPCQDLEAQSEPSGFEKFLQQLGDDYRQMDPELLDQSLHSNAPLLLPDEHVQMGFACGRDKFVLTTHRAMKVDTKGFTGKRVMYLSIPYVNCRGYCITSAGTWDADAEMELYFKAPWYEWSCGSFKIDFGRAHADIVSIQKFLSTQMVGAADGTSVVPPSILPDIAPGQVDLFLNWLGSDTHQISSDEAEQKLKSDPDILLNEETVDLAFKCGRDLTVYTTKRLLLINVQGFWGKKVSYLSVPWKYVAAFRVEKASGPLDSDSTVMLYTEGTGAGKLSMDIRSGQGSWIGCYKVLFKKTILDRL